MGADRKANTRGLVRAPSGLLQRLQRQVALEALGESGASLGTEAVVAHTASMGAEAGAESCQGALTRKRTLFGSRGASLLERLQHRVALEALRESSSSVGAELVASQTAITVEWRQVLRRVKGR